MEHYMPIQKWHKQLQNFHSENGVWAIRTKSPNAFTKELFIKEGVTMKNYDLSQNKSYQEVVAKFGGEEYLEENYPLVHKVFQNSRKYSQCELFALGETNDTATIGRQDILMSCLVENTKASESALQQVTRFNFKEQKACVIVDTTIVDENGKVYGAMTNLYENTYNKDVINDIKGIIMDHPYKLKLNTVVTSFTIDPETGEPVASVSEPIQKNESVFISSSGSVIKSVKVQDPINRYSDKSDVTYIVYGNREDQYVSYQYPNIPSPEVRDGIKYAEIWCPYKVVIKLDSNTFWEESPVSKVDFTINLESTDPEKYGGGGVCYNNRENIKTSLSADKKELTMEISPDWNAKLTVNDINLVIGAFKFYACFKVVYNVELPGGTVHHQPATVITSTDVALTESTDYVGMVRIRWGCFGKDCIFVTPQGQKRMCDLVTGDRILTVDGSFAKITNILTGHEQDIINIQLAGHEDILQLSETHGIETRRGIIPAGELKFEDEIRTAEGYQQPCFIEKRAYDDIVYNIETEAHSMLVVNGMIVSEKETAMEKPDRNDTMQKLPKELLEELKQLVEDKNQGRF